MRKILSEINYSMTVLSNSIIFEKNVKDGFKSELRYHLNSQEIITTGVIKSHEFERIMKVISIFESAKEDILVKDILILKVKGFESMSDVRMTREDFRKFINMIAHYNTKYDIIYESNAVIKQITHMDRIIIDEVD